MHESILTCTIFGFQKGLQSEFPKRRISHHVETGDSGIRESGPRRTGPRYVLGARASSRWPAATIDCYSPLRRASKELLHSQKGVLYLRAAGWHRLGPLSRTNRISLIIPGNHRNGAQATRWLLQLTLEKTPSNEEMPAHFGLCGNAAGNIWKGAIRKRCKAVRLARASSASCFPPLGFPLECWRE